MGEVWKGWDTQLGRWVALKFPRFEAAEDLARLLSEAQAAAKLSHSNVAAVYELGDHEGKHFIAMQYVDGASLAELPRMEAKRVASCIRQAAHGIAYANAAGVIHRDLKPANLMLQRDRDQVYVMDFGIARQATGLTQTSTAVVGTAPFMSPEQACGKRVDARSDVWSLGATLYQLLSGRHPFEGASNAELFHRIAHDDPRRIEGLDPDLNTVVLKCLEKDPGRRYSSAQELADDLGRWLDGDPVLAHPPSTLYRLRKRIVRRKAILIAGGAGLMVALALAIVLIPRWRGEAEARRQEKDIQRKVDEELDKARAVFESDPEQAKGFVQRALQQKPGHSPSLTLLGLIEERRGYWDAAKECWRKAVATDPRSGSAHYYLGRLLLYETALQRLGVDRAQLRMQEPEAQRLAALAGDHFKQAEAAGLDNPLQREFARAGEDYASSEPARRREALERCRRVTKEHGEKRGLEDLYWLMGFMTQKEESIDSCNAALRINSWHVMALFTRGLRAQAIGKPKEAMEDYTRAIEMHPRFKNAFLVRGKIHADAGEESPARQDYDRAIEIDPNYFTAYSNRSKLSYDFSKNDEAILDATKAIELSPGYASAYLNRGTARGGRGEWDLALEDFQKGMKLDDRPDFLWEFNLGNATFMKGAFAEARRHYQNAVQLNARHVRTWYYLSCALSSEGDPKGAADALEQAIRLSLASVLKENPQQDPRLEGLRASPEWNRVRRLLAGEK